MIMDESGALVLSRRAKFLRTYMERDVPRSVLVKYAKQMEGKPDEEKEVMAERFTRELEEYPLQDEAERKRRTVKD